MGNYGSTELEGSGMEIQSQGENDLWTVVLEGCEDGKGEGVSVFRRSPGEGIVAGLCKSAAESLRVLRHPNILKFLECEATLEGITVVTEPVLPLFRTLKEMSLEGVVVGWRCVGAGLGFLHDKVGMSHNNVWAGCVYVNVMDSHWKIGGLEAAAKIKDISAKFLSSISGIRNSKAVPPEDKSTSIAAEAVPIHSRDVWALGNFFLAVIEESGLEGEIQEEAFQYISDHLLCPNPTLRPSVTQILLQPWMSNVSSILTDFLSNFTLKSRREKDAIFCSLPEQLHSLPPQVLAENVVPLLVTPLVMADPMAKDTLWKHLFTPASTHVPRRKTFSSSGISPLLDEDLFKAHLLPLLLNLLESRDSHVRLLLLHHVGSFVALFGHDDLVGVVLPEVLVGLKDSSDEMVGATLHGLAELVPYVGAELVMGTSRKKIFMDAHPRVNSPSVDNTHHNSKEHLGSNVISPPPFPQLEADFPPVTTTMATTTSQPTRSRDERMKQMREKREQQRQKRLNQKKMGLTLADTSNTGDADLSPAFIPRSVESPQYSPSISHDEVDPEVSEESGAASNASSGVLDRRLIPPTNTSTSGVGGGGNYIGTESDASANEDDREGGASEGDKEADDWGERWSDIEDLGSAKFGSSFSMPESPSTVAEFKSVSSASDSRSHNSKASKLGLKSKVNDGKEGGNGEGKRVSESPGGKRANLSTTKEDKEPAIVEEELDLFADMAPKFPSSSTSLFPGSAGTTSKSSITSPTSSSMTTAKEVEEPHRPSSSSLTYQPQPEESTEGGWGDDDWGDEF